jgi:hypothetical protein
MLIVVAALDVTWCGHAAIDAIMDAWGYLWSAWRATSPVQSGPPPGLADAPKETLAAGLAEPQKDAPSNPAPGQGETPKAN